MQILGDAEGNVVHLYERDCSLQRRHQKILERAPAPYLTDSDRDEICNAALKIASYANINNASTIEFLLDSNSNNFYFIEVNPRVQVEHTITEQITGIDIVKVTPSSKVVGDMALAMVTSDLTVQDIENPEKEIAFPDSVVSFFRGELGQPSNGFPKALQAKILKGEKPICVRPGSILKNVNLEKETEVLGGKLNREISGQDLASALMYPNVFNDFIMRKNEFGDVSVLPTPIFLYGMNPGDEINVILEKGRHAIICHLAVGDADADGMVSVFFELNGQPRSVRIFDNKVETTKKKNEKADLTNESHVGSPMPGIVVSINVEAGETVSKGQTLFILEAMKMQTSVRAKRNGLVKNILITSGKVVDTKDLIIIMI